MLVSSKWGSKVIISFLTSSEVKMTISGKFLMPFLLTSGKALNLAATRAYNIETLPPGLNIPSPFGIPNKLRIWFKTLSSIRVKTGATSNVYLELWKSQINQRIFLLNWNILWAVIKSWNTLILQSIFGLFIHGEIHENNFAHTFCV